MACHCVHIRGRQRMKTGMFDGKRSHQTLGVMQVRDPLHGGVLSVPERGKKAGETIAILWGNSVVCWRACSLQVWPLFVRGCVHMKRQTRHTTQILLLQMQESCLLALTYDAYGYAQRLQMKIFSPRATTVRVITRDVELLASNASLPSLDLKLLMQDENENLHAVTRLRNGVFGAVMKGVIYHHPHCGVEKVQPTTHRIQVQRTRRLRHTFPRV
jgi:hypothetical protein